MILLTMHLLEAPQCTFGLKSCYENATLMGAFSKIYTTFLFNQRWWLRTTFCQFGTYKFLIPTNYPMLLFRRFMEMPSVDWREVADNWFGACCCSFGGISEKLVLQYMKTYHCAEGTGLLDSAAVIISKNDLESYVFQQYSDGKSERSNEVDTEINSEHRDAIRETCQNATEEICDTCALACSDDKVGTKVPDHETEPSSYGNHGNHVASLDLSANCSVSVRGHDSGFDEISRLAQFGLNGTHGTVVADSVKLNHWSTTPREPNQESSADQCHCCFDEASHVAEDSRPGKIRKWLHDCSLGSGFTNKTSNLSNDVEWAEFLCNNCTSVIGAYPSYKSRNEPVDGGIRLFKCYISTSISVDGPNDIFRLIITMDSDMFFTLYFFPH